MSNKKELEQKIWDIGKKISAAKNDEEQIQALLKQLDKLLDDTPETEDTTG